MADLDYILILGGGAVFAGVIGLGLAKFSTMIKTRVERKRAVKFLRGMSKNEIVMDGEKIDIKTFIYKTPDGKKLARLDVSVPIQQPEQPSIAAPVSIEPQNNAKEREFKRLSDYK
jgi:hypothetical protein